MNVWQGGRRVARQRSTVQTPFDERVKAVGVVILADDR